MLPDDSQASVTDRPRGDRPMTQLGVDLLSPGRRLPNPPPRLPLTIKTTPLLDERSAPSTTPAQQRASSMVLRHESPWLHYHALRPIYRGCRAMAAYAKDEKASLAVIKDFPASYIDRLDYLSQSRTVNLEDILQVFVHDNALFIAMEYTVISLEQILAIPRQLKESHVAVVCGEVICLALTSSPA